MKVNIKYSKLEEKESIVKSVIQLTGVVIATMAMSAGFISYQLICASNSIPVDQVAFKIISSVL